MLFLGGCLIPVNGPGCMEGPNAGFFCTLETSQGCAINEICAADDNGPTCKIRCDVASDCPAHLAECTPAAPGSSINVCRPSACASAGGCGGADAGDDWLFDAGPDDTGPPLGDGGPIDGDAWPQYGHDAKHTGRSSAVPSHAPTLLWSCDLPGSMGWTEVVVDAHSNSYVSDFQQVYAVDPGGKLRWQAGHEVRGALVEPSGEVIWTEKGGVVHGANADGTTIFDLKIAGASPQDSGIEVSRPTLGADGVVYVTTSNASSHEAALHAIDPAGLLLWSQVLSVDNHQAGQPAQDDDGSLAIALFPGIGASGTQIVKTTLTGAVVWSRPIPEAGVKPAVPTFGPGGSLRIAIGARLFGFTATGDTLFTSKFSTLGALLTPIDAPGNTHVAQLAGVSWIDSTGQLFESTFSEEGSALDIDTNAAPALAADGVLVVRRAEGPLHGLYRGKAVWSAAAGAAGGSLSVIIGPDATMYAAVGPRLFALR